MEIDRLVKDAVEKEVMQAINDLGIKSVMREKVVESGVTKGDIRQMIKELCTVCGHKKYCQKRD